MELSLTLEKIVALLKPLKVSGNFSGRIERLLPADAPDQNPSSLYWVSKKYETLARSIEAGTIICPPDFDSALSQKNIVCVFVDNPRQAFQKILTEYFLPPKKTGISPTARIHESAKIGKNVFVGDYVVIEENCEIGDESEIGHHTVLHARTKVGSKSILGCHNTIGGAGFGYEMNEDLKAYEFIPHLGNVVIGNQVEIGNSTCIDRGVLGSTVLEDHVKVDNLVHIAHNVLIKRGSLIIANAMISGSCVIEEAAWIAPSSSTLQKIRIGQKAVVGLGSVVMRDVEPMTTVAGNPARVINKSN